MLASMNIIPIWMSRGHFSDSEYDIYELDQQTLGVKQSKQFYHREGKIVLISAIRVTCYREGSLLGTQISRHFTHM
jgi:hypothetical protein